MILKHSKIQVMENINLIVTTEDKLKEIVRDAVNEALTGKKTATNERESIKAFEEFISEQTTTIDTTGATRYVYGYAGIANLFGCSIPTAARIKKSGKIDGAITQIGRKIIVDADRALELAGKPNGGRK